MMRSTALTSSKASISGASREMLGRVSLRTAALRSPCRVVAFKDAGAVKSAIERTLKSGNIWPGCVHQGGAELLPIATDAFHFEPNHHTCNMGITHAMVEGIARGEGPYAGVTCGNWRSIAINGETGDSFALFTRAHPDGMDVLEIAQFVHNEEGLIERCSFFDEVTPLMEGVLVPPVLEELVPFRTQVNAETAAYFDLTGEQLPSFCENAPRTMRAFMEGWNQTDGVNRAHLWGENSTPNAKFFCSSGGSSATDPFFTAQQMAEMWGALWASEGRFSNKLVDALLAGDLDTSTWEGRIKSATVMLADYAGSTRVQIDAEAYDSTKPVAFCRGQMTGQNPTTGALVASTALMVAQLTPDGTKVEKMAFFHGPMTMMQRTMLWA